MSKAATIVVLAGVNGAGKSSLAVLPLIHHLRVYDNSTEADPAEGKAPRPMLWLEMKEGRITAPTDLAGAPEWVQPIFLGAAMELHLKGHDAGLAIRGGT